MVAAFIDHFGYDPGTRMIFRIGYSDQEWMQTLRAQLDLGQPLLYESVTTDFSSAHYFVIDGYQGEMFHVNWGWRGEYDGYYRLDDLTPGNSNFSFDLSQIAIIGIKPGP